LQVAALSRAFTTCGIHPMKTTTYLFTDVRGFLMQGKRTMGENHGTSLPPVNLSGGLVPGMQDDEGSELVLIPDNSTDMADPLGGEHDRLVFTQPVQPGEAVGSYAKDVRGTCQRCHDRLIKSGIADEAMVGIEMEFSLLDGIRFHTAPDRNFVELKERDGWPNNADEFTNGYRIGHRSLHFLPSPHDHHVKVRDEICSVLRKVGIAPVHHGHEAGPSQQEIATAPRSLVSAADAVQLQKHIIRNVAAMHHLSATFMPRPMAYAEGNGMHVNLSLWRQGRNIFHQDGGDPGELSAQGLSFIAGVLRHVQALNAITNPTINSYRRLNHFYSPMRPAGWGHRNRTTAIRVPYHAGEADCRIEIRFPDASSNPYLALSGLICAGLDGIERGLQPPPQEHGEPKWYEQPFHAIKAADNAMAPDLRCALIALEKDKEFLTRSTVFDDRLLEALIQDGSFFWHWAATTPAPLDFQVFYGH
jgi:glutamine synthetase